METGMTARYVHTNLIARDIAALAAFYERVFGCTPIGPEQHLAGKWVEDITGVAGAAIRVMHLRMPGCGEDGPTLEVIQYDTQPARVTTTPNAPGFGHIAFAVEDVPAARDAVIAAGGGRVGEVVSVDIPGRGHLTETYVTDPEGNVVELQHWSD